MVLDTKWLDLFLFVGWVCFFLLVGCGSFGVGVGVGDYVGCQWYCAVVQLFVLPATAEFHRKAQ